MPPRPNDIPLRERPIAVIDSGLGGLTVLHAIRERLPAEHLIYVGDTARVPYGAKSPATVTRYVSELVEFLMQTPLKLLVVACNTASAVALGALVDLLDPTGSVPIVGVIGPSTHAALTPLPGGETPQRVAVIGTEGTIGGGAYQRAISSLDSRVQVLGKACPLFVPLVEEGWHDDQITRLTAERYLDEVRAWAPDRLILGCTHYPLLKNIIAEVMGPSVEILDSAVPTAREVAMLLESRGLGRQGARGQAKFYVTDGPERFRRVGGRFLGEPVHDVTPLNLETCIGTPDAGLPPSARQNPAPPRRQHPPYQERESKP